MAGLELARDWRDSSLMVPALLLELARAHAALGRGEDASAAARAGLARIAGARDAGVLGDALQAIERAASAAPGGQGLARLARPGVPPRGRAAPAQALAGASGNGTGELSGREVEVLRALAGAGSLREVADALYISRNTIKTHTRALYAKLGVGTREEAVARGRELGLVGGGLTRSRKES